MAEITPLQRHPSLEERTYLHLKEQILSQILHPGQVVTETRLAEALAVSRTPVRYALSRLISEGLVAADNDRLEVRQLSVEEARDAAEFRLAIEGHIVRSLARTGMPGEGRKALGDITERMRTLAGTHIQRSDIDEFMQLNREFHLLLAAQLGNSFIMAAAEHAQNLLVLNGRTIHRHPGRATEILREHDAIVAALDAGDVVAADEAISRHVRAPIALLRETRADRDAGSTS